MRDVNGVLFVDKVSGISSAALLSQVKFLFRAKKAGHTGTLDPLATGMLPICFGEATKFSKFLLKSDKSYRVVAKLGERTDTFDASGRVICVRRVKLDEKYLCGILNTFLGVSYQVPPMFSALKYHGCPLYQYARQGRDIFRHSRLIQMYRINLIQWDTRYIELDVFCSTGTYIRTFIDDLGESLGCGAHIVSLRRLSVGRFFSDLMIDIVTILKCVNDVGSVEYLKNLDALLRPTDILVRHFPEINVSFEIYRLLQYGQKVKLDKNCCCFSDIDQDGLVRMTLGYNKKFFGLGKVIDKKYLLVHRLVF